ncbi:MAG: TSUP family transporter, partial [Proteobacteria bacterium]|nr:TSUP family transporter [Pseudomonadota bacterium]
MAFITFLYIVILLLKTRCSMIAIALPGALLVGLSLGLLGSGGSILTVPILVYLLGQDEKVAIASSLAIVGVISIVGSLPYLREK